MLAEDPNKLAVHLGGGVLMEMTISAPVNFKWAATRRQRPRRPLSTTATATTVGSERFQGPAPTAPRADHPAFLPRHVPRYARPIPPVRRRCSLCDRRGEERESRGLELESVVACDVFDYKSSWLNARFEYPFEPTDGQTDTQADKYPFEQTDEHPVVNVSWRDAVAFCEWLSKKEGKGFWLADEGSVGICMPRRLDKLLLKRRRPRDLR